MKNEYKEKIEEIFNLVMSFIGSMWAILVFIGLISIYKIPLKITILSEIFLGVGLFGLFNFFKYIFTLIKSRKTKKYKY